MFVTKGEEKTLNIRLELSSEADLFFHFSHSLSSDSYAEVQQMQKLMVDYDDYPKVLAKMLTSCIKEPERFVNIVHVIHTVVSPSLATHLLFLPTVICVFSLCTAMVAHN